MHNTWILAADEARARILRVVERERLDEIRSFVNPGGRLPEREQQADAEARLNGRAGGGVASDREARGPGEHSVAVFARDIGRLLEAERINRAYDELLVIAPPKFLGALRREFTDDVERLVARQIPKDLSWFSPRELERYLGRRA